MLDSVVQVSSRKWDGVMNNQCNTSKIFSVCWQQKYLMFLFVVYTQLNLPPVFRRNTCVLCVNVNPRFCVLFQECQYLVER